MVDVPQLRSVLGSPELAWLIRRARQRLERAAGITGTATLRNPSAARRAAIDRLLGRPASRSAGLTVSLDQLDNMLGSAGIAKSLREAVETLKGEVVNVRAQRARQERYDRHASKPMAHPGQRDGRMDEPALRPDISSIPETPDECKVAVHPYLYQLDQRVSQI